MSRSRITATVPPPLSSYWPYWAFDNNGNRRTTPYFGSGSSSGSIWKSATPTHSGTGTFNFTQVKGNVFSSSTNQIPSTCFPNGFATIPSAVQAAQQHLGYFSDK